MTNQFPPHIDNPNIKPRRNYLFLIGLFFGIGLSYLFFHFQVAPFECPTVEVTPTTSECPPPEGTDEDPRFGRWLEPNEGQTFMDKFANEPLNPELNKTFGGRIGKANLQRLLCDMPNDGRWIHFRYGITEVTNPDGTTQNRLVVLFRNGVFPDPGNPVVPADSRIRTIMNLGFCPIDCGND